VGPHEQNPLSCSDSSSELFRFNKSSFAEAGLPGRRAFFRLASSSSYRCTNLSRIYHVKSLNLGRNIPGISSRKPYLEIRPCKISSVIVVDSNSVIDSLK
jgi:hypothetical protein